MEADDASLWGREGIYRNGERVGHVTSGGIGHTVNDGRAIGLGYVAAPRSVPVESTKAFKEWTLDGAYELEVAGRRVAARAHWEPLYDHNAKRMRDVA